MSVLSELYLTQNKNWDQLPEALVRKRTYVFLLPQFFCFNCLFTAFLKLLNNPNSGSMPLHSEAPRRGRSRFSMPCSFIKTWHNLKNSTRLIWSARVLQPLRTILVFHFSRIWTVLWNSLVHLNLSKLALLKKQNPQNFVSTSGKKSYSLGIFHTPSWRPGVGNVFLPIWKKEIKYVLEKYYVSTRQKYQYVIIRNFALCQHVPFWQYVLVRTGSCVIWD